MAAGVLGSPLRPVQSLAAEALRPGAGVATTLRHRTEGRHAQDRQQKRKRAEQPPAKVTLLHPTYLVTQISHFNLQIYRSANIGYSDVSGS